MVISEQARPVIGGASSAPPHRHLSVSMLAALALIALLSAGVAGLLIARRVAPPPSAAPAAGTGATTPIVIMAIDAGCGPRDVQVAAPGNVPITFHNHGQVARTFTIDGIAGQLTAQPRGDSVEGVFSLPRPGRYTFWCGGTGQQATAMSGTLIVGGDPAASR